MCNCNLTSNKDVLYTFLTAVLSPVEISVTEAENLYYYGNKDGIAGCHLEREIRETNRSNVREWTLEKRKRIWHINRLRYMGLSKKEIMLATGYGETTVNNYFNVFKEVLPSGKPCQSRVMITDRYFENDTGNAFLAYLKTTVSNRNSILGNKDKDKTIYERLLSGIAALIHGGMEKIRLWFVLTELIERLQEDEAAQAYFAAHGFTKQYMRIEPVDGIEVLLWNKAMGGKEVA